MRSLASLILTSKGLFVLDSLEVLLIFNFLLDVLVSLEQLIMLVLSKLQPLVEVSLQLLLKSIHLVLLFLNKFGLGGNDLLMPILHVFFSLSDFKLLAHHLDLMRLSILLLLGEPLLDSLLIEELGTILEGERQLLLKNLSVLLNLLRVAIFQLAEGLGVLLLRVQEVFVPLLVELLILLDVSLLALLSLLGLIEDELFVAAVVVLMLQLRDSILRHFCLHVLLLVLTGSSVILKDSDEVLDVVSCWLLVESLFHVVTLHTFYLQLNVFKFIII